MSSRLARLRTALEESLDDLASPRSSNTSKTTALRALERLLAGACVPSRHLDDGELETFLALQLTFECNVPIRLLAFIAAATVHLDGLGGTKGWSATGEEADSDEAVELSTQLGLALSLLQGVALTHGASKTFLGRRPGLEVLLDLFLAARHLPLATPPGQCLASTALDTLLCVLVDAPRALRVFEAAQGLHAVVRVLKRAATPREVRMKCLEFLYFYLLDETAAPTLSTPPAASTPKPKPTQAARSLPSLSSTPKPMKTAPSTPLPDLMKTAPSTPLAGSRKPFPTPAPRRPHSRYGSSTFSLTSSSFAGSSDFRSSDGTSERSGSGGSMRVASDSTSSSEASDLSSTSSDASSTSSRAGSTSPTKRTQFAPPAPRAGSSSPKKHAQFAPAPGSPTKQAYAPLAPRSPSKRTQTPATPRAQPRALLMLRRELDFVPISPNEAGVGVAGVSKMKPKLRAAFPTGAGRGERDGGEGWGPEDENDEARYASGSGGGSSDTDTTRGSDGDPDGEDTKVGEGELDTHDQRHGEQERETRTTAQKKALLGTLLGNVDALVEGVRRAGVWGLG
ncbi:cell division control protein 14, SIN component-domain-containing protein [Mycena belliarum]|uniref:Cell division control protein 14, SIN component-domain-containing protein n=1 Tax=Mycena belliarum TaxID=1033014 RepID=A0AAD6XWY1_9AGAR|nr:cell division control protein 14, SIN component-domain-containing protein [Mycena belliae]